MSFEQFTIGEWVIEVDRQATEAAYLKEETIACSCPGCQNYLAACRTWPGPYPCDGSIL